MEKKHQSESKRARLKTERQSKPGKDFQRDGSLQTTRKICVQNAPSGTANFKRSSSRNDRKSSRKLPDQKVSELGGKAWKFVSPGNAGVPDRLITYNSKAFFVEVKRPGGKPRALQKATVAQIRATGMKVYCISTKAQVDELTNLMRSGIIPEERHFDRI